MVSAKWRAKVRAHLTGGPLLGRYVFSQLHFHWGQQDTEGSEHTLQGDSFPLEMHMVLFKSRYLTQEAALKEMDGVVEVAYFFQLEALRSVYGLDGNPLLRNWRKAHPPMGRTVLHVVPPGTKKSIKGDQFSEGVPAEKRQTRFSPDWTENEQEAPPDAEPDRPKSGRRFLDAASWQHRWHRPRVPGSAVEDDGSTEQLSFRCVMLSIAIITGF
ncbi:carbonic anhydrase 4-like [Schistocerca americana]|uniref:carbonic anhydrase 4-like n=1 Tax=Schistocerca americana TaxID=7009 RepID=UPI001F4F3F82|nr:carbonic anhydrase 4-like [Schistocerca americana]